LDLSHGRLDDGLARTAESLVATIARWLSRHESGGPLARLLDQERTLPPSGGAGVAPVAREHPVGSLARREKQLAQEASPRSTLFKTLDVHVSELGEYPDLCLDICLGRFQVSIIRGVYSREAMETVLARLLPSEHGMPIAPQQTPDLSVEQVTMYGVGITPNSVELNGAPPDRYHASAIQFREACRRLFAGLDDYETVIDGLFRRVSGGRDIEVPRDREGRIFAPSTIRKVPPGREINMHVGNYFLTTPAYAHLNPLLAQLDQLSFFIPVSPPESGGAIEVYELQYGDPETPKSRDGFVESDVVRRRYRFESFEPGQGDMFLFNGGRYYHRVDHVVGDRPRWTIGGFLAVGSTRPVIYYWS
jgi:hypothetical protein